MPARDARPAAPSLTVLQRHGALGRVDGVQHALIPDLALADEADYGAWARRVVRRATASGAQPQAYRYRAWRAAGWEEPHT